MNKRLKSAAMRTMLSALLSAMLVMARLAGADAPALQLYYYERPPFHYTNEAGQPTGQIIASTEQALRRAGLRFEWVRMPANRILSTLRAGPALACSPGWYSTSERRADFWFSSALLRDKPLIALLRADFPLPQGITAKTLFQIPGVRLLLKQNFSQGAYMNTLIARMPAAQVQQVAAEVPVMVQMLKANRADVIITTEAEAELFVHQAGFAMGEFRIARLQDVPADEYRYLLCNRSIPAPLRARIDDAVRATGPSSGVGHAQVSKGMP